MPPNPLVSVIIPTFNRQSVLPCAVASVLQQRFKDFDLWIIDDGSTDDTRTCLESALEDCRVHYVRIDNHGVSFARNIGVMLGRGEWLAFLDSDDEWLPEKLEKQLALAKERPDLQLIHGEEIWIRRGVRVNQRKIHQKFGGRIFQQCLPLCLISPSAAILKRTLLKEVKGFDESFPVCEDYDLWLKITSRYDVGFIQAPIIIKHGGHEDQLSQRFKAMDYWRVKAMLRHLNSSFLSELESEALREEIKRKGDILFKGYEKHGHVEKIEELKQMLKDSPP